MVYINDIPYRQTAYHAIDRHQNKCAAAHLEPTIWSFWTTFKHHHHHHHRILVYKGAAATTTMNYTRRVMCHYFNARIYCTSARITLIVHIICKCDVPLLHCHLYIQHHTQQHTHISGGNNQTFIMFKNSLFIPLYTLIWLNSTNKSDTKMQHLQI